MSRPFDLVIVATVLIGAPASAATSSSEEADTLVQSIGREGETLGASDCEAACKALASMQRSTDRLCAIEPGPRCYEARAKVERAQRKVRESCGACAMAEPHREVASAQAAPPAESRRGGCAGCTVGGAGGGSYGAALGALVVLACIERRRRRSRGR